jgi:pyruvate dehydrogenase E1 component beta subunit
MGIIAAMRESIAHEMRMDNRVFAMGEDVELAIWGYTCGLVDEFGHERVRNTPICEAAFTGAAVGAAAPGLRPIADLMCANFMYTAMDQIANQVAKLPYVTDGQIRLPMVLVAVA